MPIPASRCRERSGTVRGTHFSSGNRKRHQTLTERNGARGVEKIIHLFIGEEGNRVGLSKAGAGANDGEEGTITGIGTKPGFTFLSNSCQGSPGLNS